METGDRIPLSEIKKSVGGNVRSPVSLDVGAQLMSTRGNDLRPVEITRNYGRSLSFITEGDVIDLITYGRTNRDRQL